MHRARLAEEAGAELREHLVRRAEDAPEAVGIVAVVGRMHAILGERDRIGDFVRLAVDRDRDAEAGQRVQHVAVEFRDRHRLEHDLAEVAVAGAHPQHVIDEVEIDLEGARAVGDRRRGEPARGDVERHVPGMIEPGRAREPDLADDLRPQLQRLGRCPATPHRAARASDPMMEPMMQPILQALAFPRSGAASTHLQLVARARKARAERTHKKSGRFACRSR